MRYDLNDGALTVTAETAAEVLFILKHYGLDILAHTDALSAGSLSHTLKSNRRENGAWFACSTVLGAEWLAPYMARLERMTGYSGQLADMPAPLYPGSNHNAPILHTHIVESARISSTSATFAGFIESGDWNGKSAAERAPLQFSEYVRAGMGDTKREPEYLELDNGLMRRNPNYLRQHAPHPAAASVTVFGALYTQWLQKYATPAQRDVVEKCIANHKTVCKTDTLGAFFLRTYENGYRTAWDGADSFVTFEQFKAI